MNIFMLDKCPVQSAQSMVDKHVVKMILESAQLLSTAHRVLDGAPVEVTLEKDGKRRKKTVWILGDERNDILYNATHINHPSATWARQSISNYSWLVDHLFALSDEYTHRYNKRHATMVKLGYLIQSPPFNLNDWEMTKMPSCMDPEYIVSEDPVENYRNYYRLGKANLHSWKNRQPPSWI